MQILAAPPATPLLPAVAAWLAEQLKAPAAPEKKTVWLPTQAIAERLRFLLTQHGLTAEHFCLRTLAWEERRDGLMAGPAAAAPALERLAWHQAITTVRERLRLPDMRAEQIALQAQQLQALCSRLTDYEKEPAALADSVPTALLRHWQLTARLVEQAFNLAERYLSDQGVVSRAAWQQRSLTALAMRVASSSEGAQIILPPLEPLPVQARMLQALLTTPAATLLLPEQPSKSPLVATLLAQLEIPLQQCEVLLSPPTPLQQPGYEMIAAPDATAEGMAVATVAQDFLLATPTARVAVVCADTALRQELAEALRRTGLHPAQPAGLALGQTAAGQLAQRLLAVMATLGNEADQPLATDFPLAMATLGAHPLAATQDNPLPWLALDTHLWRGVRASTWTELRRKADQVAAAEGLQDAVTQLAETFATLPQPRKLADWASWFSTTLTVLLPAWPRGWGAQALQAWLASWPAAGAAVRPSTCVAWALQDLAAQRIMAPTPTAPIVHLWAPKDAAWQDSDVIIVAGLNEGSWPARQAETLLDSTMLTRLGLRSYTQEAVRARADFAHLLQAAPVVVVSRQTHSKGQETVPAADWTQLLAQHPDALQQGKRWLVPQAPARPQTEQLGVWPALQEDWPVVWSASWLRSVMDCPYQAVGQRQLKLAPLNPFGMLPDKATTGTLVHQWMEAFWQQPARGNWPAPWTANKADLQAADRQAAEAHFILLAQHGLRDEAALVRRLWRPRLPRLAAAIIDEWLKDAAQGRQPELLETTLEADGMKAQADRIDRQRAVGAAGWVVVDYKTGHVPTPEEIRSGRQPQLPLEGWLIDQHPEMNRLPVVGMEYWKLRGYGRVAVERKIIKTAEVMALMESAATGIPEVKKALGPAAAYPATPEPAGACQRCHLAGVCRWRAAEASQ